MVELQILNRVLKDKNTSLLDLNDITRDYFNQYQEEYDYIRNNIIKEIIEYLVVLFCALSFVFFFMI